MLSGRVSTTTSVRIQLIVSIMTMTPISVSAEVSSWVRFCCSVPLMLSRSFTARLITSPRVRESKNFNGSRSNLASTSRRIAYTVFCATLAIRYCIRYWKPLATMYRPISPSRIRPT